MDTWFSFIHISPKGNYPLKKQKHGVWTLEQSRSKGRREVPGSKGRRYWGGDSSPYAGTQEAEAGALPSRSIKTLWGGAGEGRGGREGEKRRRKKGSTALCGFHKPQEVV